MHKQPGLDRSLNRRDATLGRGSQWLEDAVTEPMVLEVPRTTRPFPLLILVFRIWPLPPSPASLVPTGELKQQEPRSPRTDEEQEQPRAGAGDGQLQPPPSLLIERVPLG